MQSNDRNIQLQTFLYSKHLLKLNWFHKHKATAAPAAAAPAAAAIADEWNVKDRPYQALS